MLYQFDRSRRAPVAVLCVLVIVFATGFVLVCVLTSVPALACMLVISIVCAIVLKKHSLDPTQRIKDLYPRWGYQAAPCAVRHTMNIQKIIDVAASTLMYENPAGLSVRDPALYTVLGGSICVPFWGSTS